MWFSSREFEIHHRRDISIACLELNHNSSPRAYISNMGRNKYGKLFASGIVYIIWERVLLVLFAEVVHVMVKLGL